MTDSSRSENYYQEAHHFEKQFNRISSDPKFYSLEEKTFGSVGISAPTGVSCTFLPGRHANGHPGEAALVSLKPARPPVLPQQEAPGARTGRHLHGTRGFRTKPRGPQGRAGITHYLSREWHFDGDRNQLGQETPVECNHEHHWVTIREHQRHLQEHKGKPCNPPGKKSVISIPDETDFSSENVTLCVNTWFLSFHNHVTSTT